MIPGLGRSPGEEKGYPLQDSGLENSMNCIVHGVAKSQTQLSDFDCITWKELQTLLLSPSSQVMAVGIWTALCEFALCFLVKFSYQQLQVKRGTTPEFWFLVSL